MREDVDGGISIVSTPYGDLSVTVKVGQYGIIISLY